MDDGYDSDACPRCGTTSEEPWYTLPWEPASRAGGWTVLCRGCFRAVIGREPPNGESAEHAAARTSCHMHVPNRLLRRLHPARHLTHP